MITIYTLADAAPVAFFGIFALWAAASKRHWFLRTAVVGGAILGTLLIPAYEVLISLTVETLLVVAGVAFWRRRRYPAVGMRPGDTAPRFHLRLSMETLMLTIVIVAVVTAVAARVPRIPGESWYSYTIDGLMSGTVGLASVWIICGRARWWIRAMASPILVFLLAFSLVTLHWAVNIVKYWFLLMSGTTVNARSMTEYLQLARRDIWPATLSWTSTVALGMAILCAWLYCLRRAGWFDPFNDMPGDATATPRTRRSTTAARVCAAILFGLVAIFPLALFYALLTPTPIPNEPLPDPNGFDDLIAAGNMIGPTAARTLQNWDRLTVEQLGAELAKHQRAFDRMNLGLQRHSRNPYVFKPWPPENSLSLINLWNGWYGKAAFDRRNNNLEQELSNNLTLLRLAHVGSRGSGIHFGGIFKQYEKDGYTGIWNCASRLSTGKCFQLIAKLRDIEARREPWNQRLATQRAIDDNSGWQNHLRRILADWSGEDQYKWQRIEEWRRVAQLSMLIVKLAIRAYQWENNDQLPESLEELVPTYLQEVPIDPFGGKKLHYRKDGNKYVLYSCGPDEDDDGGQPLSEENGQEIGDISDAALFNPPVFQPSIGPP